MLQQRRGLYKSCLLYTSIIVFKPKTSEEDVRKVASVVEAKGLTTHIVVGEDVTICGVIGDTTKVDPKQIEVSSVVERVMHVSEPYKLANRAFHPCLLYTSRCV